MADDRAALGSSRGRRDEERAAPAPVPLVAAAPAAEPRPLEARKGGGLDKESSQDFAAAPRVAAAEQAPQPEDVAQNSAPRQKKAAQAAGPAGAVGGLGASGQGSQGDAFASAMDLFNSGRYAEAERAFDDIEASRSRDAPRAALYAAKSSDKAFGCGTAAPKYEMAWARYSTTSPGAEALWLAAKCYKDLANYGKARDLLGQLRGIAGYRDKAEGELANLNILQQQQVAAKARAAPPPAKPAAPKATSNVGQ
jgi:hypothetical protein